MSDRVAEIRARLVAIAGERHACCATLSRLDDEREQLLVELEPLDRGAYRAEAL